MFLVLPERRNQSDLQIPFSEVTRRNRDFHDFSFSAFYWNRNRRNRDRLIDVHLDVVPADEGPDDVRLGKVEVRLTEFDWNKIRLSLMVEIDSNKIRLN